MGGDRSRWQVKKTKNITSNYNKKASLFSQLCPKEKKKLVLHASVCACRTHVVCVMGEWLASTITQTAEALPAELLGHLRQHVLKHVLLVCKYKDGPDKSLLAGGHVPSPGFKLIISKHTGSIVTLEVCATEAKKENSVPPSWPVDRGTTLYKELIGSKDLLLLRAKQTKYQCQ